MEIKLNNKLESILKPILRFKELIWFLVLFMFFDVIWKMAVHEGENESIMLLFSKDVSSYLHGLCLWTANTTYWVVHDLLGYHSLSINGTILQFPGSLQVDIIWSCTSLKQFMQFAFVLLFYFGPKAKKMWYIPLSILVLGIVNIARLSIIMLIIKDGFPEWFISFNEFYNGRKWDGSRLMYWTFYKDWFHVFHRDIFAWVYYDGVIFVLWLIWEEKFNKPFRRLRNAAKEEEIENAEN